MIKKVSSLVTLKETNNPTSCLLLLPGRHGSAHSMLSAYKNLCLHNTLLVSVTPENQEWYPMPNGVNDQNSAVIGLPAACRAIDQILQTIKSSFGFAPEQTGIIGFSAGAVMGLYCAANLPYYFPVVVSHAGAILETNLIPPCKPNKMSMPIIIMHNHDDGIFSWEERYLPMRKCLKQKGYRLTTAEKKWGGHSISTTDLMVISRFAAKHLGYGNKYKGRFGKGARNAFSEFVFG